MNPGNKNRDFFIMTNSVYIQGYEGSFHQAAAINFFGRDIRVFPARHLMNWLKKLH
jgi:prephenate dehydratase